jgi:hypothetical protein
VCATAGLTAGLGIGGRWLGTLVMDYKNDEDKVVHLCEFLSGCALFEIKRKRALIVGGECTQGVRITRHQYEGLSQKSSTALVKPHIGITTTFAKD